MKRGLSVTKLSWKCSLLTFRLNAVVIIKVKVLMLTGAFSQNDSKLFSKLKLVTDNISSLVKYIILQGKSLYDWSQLLTIDSPVKVKSM